MVKCTHPTNACHRAFARWGVYSQNTGLRRLHYRRPSRTNSRASSALEWMPSRA
jgi:hypothetical protein